MSKKSKLAHQAPSMSRLDPTNPDFGNDWAGIDLFGDTKKGEQSVASDDSGKWAGVAHSDHLENERHDERLAERSRADRHDGLSKIGRKSLSDSKKYDDADADMSRTSGTSDAAAAPFTQSSVGTTTGSSTGPSAAGAATTSLLDRLKEALFTRSPDEGFPTSTYDNSGETHIDSLTTGTKWGGGLGEGVTLTCSFRTSSSVYTDGYDVDIDDDGIAAHQDGAASFSETQKTAARQALKFWSNVADVIGGAEILRPWRRKTIRFRSVIDRSQSIGDIAQGSRNFGF